MSRVRAGRALRTVLGATVAGLFAVGIVPQSSRAATAPTAFVNLRGVGSWGAYQQLVGWEDDLGAATKPVYMSYTAHGTSLGRQDFLAGNADFVISGVGFTDAELAAAKKTRSDFISAPVSVSSMAFLFGRPRPNGLNELRQICDPDADPSTWPPGVTDPSECFDFLPYTGPIKVPSPSLAAMAFQYAVPQPGSPLPLLAWNHPDVLAAMGVSNFALKANVAAGPTPTNRSDSDEMNFYLQQFAKAAAPAVWNGLKAEDPTAPWEPITERLGRTLSGSRDGVDQQSQQLLFGADASGTISNFAAGVVAPVPASAKPSLERSFPTLAKVEYAQMQNANGDWVVPTPQSISAGIAAGDGAALYALTNKVPNAYPLSWVDSIYVPAKGLTVAQTEGFATMIRYLATEGQTKAAPVGEGQLSPALVKVALAKADEVVQSNCTGSDRTIVKSTDPGRVAPKSVGKYNIGPMLHCQGLTTQSTTTTTTTVGPPTTATAQTAPGSTPVTGAPGPYDTTPTTVPTAPSTPPTTGASTTTAKPTTTTVPYNLAVATALPLNPPATTNGPDRLLTFLVGVALYLILARPLIGLAQRGRS